MLYVSFSAGWYCYGSSIMAMPSDPVQGGRCSVGQYCPEGSEAPIECPGGEYCQTTGLSTPTGICFQGRVKYLISY